VLQTAPAFEKPKIEITLHYSWLHPGTLNQIKNSLINVSESGQTGVVCTLTVHCLYTVCTLTVLK